MFNNPIPKRYFVIILSIILVVVLLSGCGINTKASKLLKEETFSVQDFDTLVVLNDSKGIEITSTGTDTARILQYGSPGIPMENIFTIDMGSGRATINSKNKAEYFGLFRKQEKLIIELPASWIANITIDSSSGGIKIKDSFVWKNALLTCSSGGININQELTAENLSIDVSSGGISLNAPVKAGSITINSSSGSVETDAIDTSKLDISSSSGGICVGETITNDFNIVSFSGGVSVADITGSGRIDANSGGIVARLNDSIGNVDLVTSSGAIKIIIGESLSFSFMGETTSGSISSNFLLQQSDKRHASVTIGDNPIAVITAKATSGGIEINHDGK